MIASRHNVLHRLVELEFTAPVAFAALAVVYVASRIPASIWGTAHAPMRGVWP